MKQLRNFICQSANIPVETSSVKECIEARLQGDWWSTKCLRQHLAH